MKVSFLVLIGVWRKRSNEKKFSLSSLQIYPMHICHLYAFVKVHETASLVSKLSISLKNLVEMSELSLLYRALSSA